MFRFLQVLVLLVGYALSGLVGVISVFLLPLAWAAILTFFAGLGLGMSAMFFVRELEVKDA